MWEEFYRLYSIHIKENTLGELKEPLDILVNIFFEPNSDKYKSITKIYNNKHLEELDREMFNSILTSNSFLEQIDIESLTELEQEIIINELKYSSKKEMNRLEYNVDISKKQIVKYETISNTLRKNITKLRKVKNLLAEIQLRSVEKIIENNKTK